MNTSEINLIITLKSFEDLKVSHFLFLHFQIFPLSVL